MYVKGLYFPFYETKTTIKKPYVFNCYEIPGYESDNFKKYLKTKFSANWIDSANIQKMFLFSWDEITKNGINRLTGYLSQKFGIEWIKSAKIEKIEKENTIKLTNKEQSISLKLNTDKTKVNIEIKNDSRTDELIVNDEKGNLNIYLKTNITNINNNINNLKISSAVKYPEKSIILTITPGKPEITLTSDEGKTFSYEGELIDGRLIIYEEEVVPLSTVLYGDDPFSFCILLPDPYLSESTYDTIKRIIEEQKPAHTCYGLKMLEPWFSLDMHTYLDVNTRLTYPSLVMNKTSILGRDTVLYDREHAGQVRVHSRIGVDTKLT
jgi:hypothetical protein